MLDWCRECVPADKADWVDFFRKALDHNVAKVRAVAVPSSAPADAADPAAAAAAATSST